MTVLKILQVPDRRLRSVASPVTVVDDEVRALLDDLLETLDSAGGIGLAAPQVGDPRRVAVIRAQGPGGPVLRLINPELIEHHTPARCEESCLSVPGVTEVVPRDYSVKVRALDLEGRPFEHRAEGLEAACVQHELDHLDGRLFTDRLSLLKRLGLKLRRQV